MVDIDEMSQCHRPRGWCYTDFQLHIDDTGYNDVVQKMAFYERLSTEIKNYLATLSWRDMHEFEGLVGAVIWCEILSTWFLAERPLFYCFTLPTEIS